MSSFDEALSLYIAQQPPAKIWFLHLKGIDFTFPFFNYLLSLWIKISTSIIWARIFSLIFGIITIYLTYKIGSFLFNKEIGLLGAFFVSCSEYFIWHSVEARVYALFTVFVLLALFYFLKFIYNPSFKEKLFFILFTVLSIYAHFFGFFIILIQFLIFIFNKKKIKITFEELYLCLSIVVISIVPLIFYYFNQYHNFYKLGNYVGCESCTCFSFLIGSLESYSNHKYFLWLYIIILGLLVFIKFKELKSSDFLKNIRIIFNKLYSIFGIKISLIILLISLLTTCILSWGKIKIYGFKYVIPFFVFFYLLLSKTIVSFKGRIKNFIIILLITALSLNGLRFAIYCSFLKPRIKLDKISKIIKNNNYKNSLIVSNDIYNSMAIFASLNNPIKIITNKKY